MSDKDDPGSESGAGDLDVLHPERELRIGDETITVREFSFIDGLSIETYATPLIKSLDETFSQDADPELETLRVIFGAHSEQMVAMLARATGRDEAWVRSLNDADGQNLLLTFWTANAGFFGRRVAARRVSQHALAQRRARASDGSTPSSSPPVTISLKSGDTPAAS